jgi:hypothetical protein
VEICHVKQGDANFTSILMVIFARYLVTNKGHPLVENVFIRPLSRSRASSKRHRLQRPTVSRFADNDGFRNAFAFPIYRPFVLPASVRKAMGLHGDAKVILTVEDDQVRLSPIGYGVSRAQALYRE